MDALSLPTNLQIFGQETAMEFMSVTDALLRDMSPEHRECRIYVGGDAADWLFSEWSLWPHLAHWTHDGVRVRFIIPDSVLDQMYWDEAHALASRIEGMGIEACVCEGDGIRVNDAFLVAEIEGPRGAVRWAASGLEALCPGELWGSAGESEVRILRHAGDGVLASPLARPPRTDELRKPRPGTFTEIFLADELDGDIGDVGAKFWRTIEQAIPGLSARLTTAPALTAIEYTDRYVNSPLVAATLHAILRALHGRPGGIVSETRFDLTTANIRPSKRTPSRLHHDWPRSEDKRDVLEHLFSPLCATVVAMKETKDMRHDRGLSLVWPDGTRFDIKLDQGLGFLRQDTETYNFHARPAEQADTIRAKTGVHVEKGDSPPVPAYLSGLQRG